MAVLSAHLLFLYRVFVWLGNATDYIQQLHNSSRPASDRLCSVCTVIPDIALLPAWNLSYVRLLVTQVCLIKIQVPHKSCDWRLFDHVKSSYFSTVYRLLYWIACFHWIFEWLTSFCRRTIDIAQLVFIVVSRGLWFVLSTAVRVDDCLRLHLHIYSNARASGPISPSWFDWTPFDACVVCGITTLDIFAA